MKDSLTFSSNAAFRDIRNSDKSPVGPHSLKECIAANEFIQNSQLNGQDLCNASSLGQQEESTPSRQTLNTNASPIELNLCLPSELNGGPTRLMTRLSLPLCPIRAAISQPLLDQKIYSPSVENGALKGSVVRHALLKPSVTNMEPVDLGLPTQPVLSKSTVLLLGEPCSQDDTIATTDYAHGPPVPAPAEILAKWLTIRDVSETTESTNDTKLGFPSPDKTVDALHFKDPCMSYDNGNAGFQVPIPPTANAIKSTIPDIARLAASTDLSPAGVKQEEAAKGSWTSVTSSLIKTAYPIDEQPRGCSCWEGHLSTNRPGAAKIRHYNGKLIVDQLAENPGTDSARSVKSLTEEQGANLLLDVVTTPNSRIDSGLIGSHCCFLDNQKAKNCVNTVKETAAIDADLFNSATLRGIIPEAPSDQDQGSILPNDDTPESAAHKWNSFCWDHSLAEESTSAYAIVPPRKCPLDKKAPISRMKSVIIPPRKHVLKQFFAKADEKLQPVSSLSSYTLDLPRLSHVGPVDSSERNSNSISAKQSESSLSMPSRRDVTFWREPYATRLTALPQQAQRHFEGPSRSSGFVLAGSHQTVTPAENAKPSGLQASETFARTIDELENLLNEALQVARQAAEKGDEDYFPNLLNDSVDVLSKDGRTFSQGLTQNRDGTTGLRKRIPRSLRSKKTNSLDSIHESARSILSNTSYNSSIISINDGRSLFQDASSKTVHLPASQIINIKPNLAVSNSQNKDQSHEPTKESTGARLLGKGAISIISNALKTSSVTSRSRKVPNVRGGNAVLTYTSDLNCKQHNEVSIEHQIKEGNSESPSVPSRRSSIKPRSTVMSEPHAEDEQDRIETGNSLNSTLRSQNVTELTRVFHQQLIEAKDGSFATCEIATRENRSGATESKTDDKLISVVTKLRSLKPMPSWSSRYTTNGNGNNPGNDFSAFQSFRNHAALVGAETSQCFELKDLNGSEENLPRRHISGRRIHEKLHHLKYDKLSHLSLRGKSHVSIRGHAGFSLSRSHKRQPIARDWSTGRKRFVASVACISTALVGVIIGIYAGEVPSIQYYIADLQHYAILGNVFFFIGIAFTTFLFWPLPLLHGRKPYILTSMAIAMPLLFPQAVSVSMQRSPYVACWRVGLILPRAFMGCALGFANMNFMATLTDLFGASLMSGNPHQERVDEYDVRRHGGGLGIWLGIWTWCYMGSIGLGFFIGAWIINSLSPDWGFYVTIILIAAVLILNVLTPEVRRSAYRRSIAEIRTPNEISRRLARGEIMMHRLQTGPKWWGEEVHQGALLSRDMIRQPGFLIMSLYVAWMYGQIVLTIVFLGSLMSKYYRFTSPFVGLTAMAIPFGALFAVPFQKASLFSRARHHPQRTDSMTFDRKITFSSHLIRRGIFTLVLPFAGLAYTLSSRGPPTPFILPVLFAGLIGFLSNLAIAECNGIIMETFDTSDLQPGMTGRPRGASGERTKHKRTNYSSFPRISSAFAIIQALGFLIAAAATGVGGVAERHLGAMSATGVMAGILLVLTFLFLCILIRWKEVQIIPSHRVEDMEKWEQQRQLSAKKQEEAAAQGILAQPQSGDDEKWRPVIIGNPSGKFRRMSVLELGSLSRWSEIRRKNRLIDEMSYEAQHPNLATLDDVRKELRDRNLDSLRRYSSKRSRRSLLSRENSVQPEAEQQDAGDLGERRVVSS